MNEYFIVVSPEAYDHILKTMGWGFIAGQHIVYSDLLPIKPKPAIHKVIEKQQTRKLKK